MHFKVVACGYLCTWQSRLTDDASEQRQLLQSPHAELLTAQQGLNGVSMDY